MDPGIPGKDYDRWLAQGRRQHQHKDYAGAVASFRKAYSARPGDAGALAELGYAAYFAKDLDLAETATRAALGHAGIYQNELRGAALYNLGLILEASGRKTEAILSYSESFLQRPSTAAKTRLTALDPVASESVLAFRGHSLHGPIPTLFELCRDPEVTLCSIPDAPEGFEPLLAGPSSLPPQPPYRDIRVVGTRSGPFGSHALAIRTSAGWYTHGLFGTNMAVTGASSSGAEIKSLRYENVVGGKPSEIVLSYEFSSASGGASPDRGNSSSTEFAMLICGLDRRAAPVCLDPLVLESRRYVGEEEVSTYRLSAHFVAPGWVEIAHEEGKLPDSWRAQLGRHRMVFGP
ncbi:MAG: hypothetical protein JW940_39345 [Polyangiaceae bacterium]|nr:hypothetical protein [Polyangiaceae bacterium]